MSKDWDSLSRSEKKEEAQKTLHMLKRQRSKMKYITKEIKGTLIALFIIIASQFENLDDIHIRNENLVMILITGIILGGLIQQIFDVMKKKQTS